MLVVGHGDACDGDLLLQIDLADLIELPSTAYILILDSGFASIELLCTR